MVKFWYKRIKGDINRIDEVRLMIESENKSKKGGK